MREAARSAAARGTSASDDATPAQSASSFEEKLAAVRAQGAEVREARAAAAPTMMDEIIAGGQGGRKVSKSAGGSIYDRAPESMGGGITLGEVGGKAEEDDALTGVIRAGSAILAVGLLLVFLPSDLTSSTPVRQRELTPEVLEQVKQRAEEYEKQLESTPQDVAGLKGAAESYVVLEEYASAAPLLQRIVDIEPSIENVDNLADVLTAAGKPFKAAEAYKNAIEAEWSGVRPSPSLLKGFVDALDKDGRYGLSLSYIKDFRQKSMADDVDLDLLEARVYSGWKGHGKEAEEKYRAVVDGHPDDFRGYLAKGVFFREIGKPAEADALFRQAKSLAPKEMADVVSAVIAQAKLQN